MSKLNKDPTQLDRAKTWVLRFNNPNTVPVNGVSYTPRFTLRFMSTQIGSSETAASARLRDLRKLGYDVLRKTRKTESGTRVLYSVSSVPVREVDSDAALKKRNARRKVMCDIIFQELQAAPEWASNIGIAINISRALVP